MKRTSKYDDIHKEAVKQRSITPETYKGVKAEFIEYEVPSIDKVNIIKDDFFYVDKYEYKKSNVSHFGINTYSKELISEVKLYNTNVSKDKLLDLQSIASAISKKDKVIESIEGLQKTSKILLTEFEKISTREAISYLSKDPNTTTVLVDIFVRDADNKVTIDKGGEPVIHTAVLYKQDGKCLVIDPSNANFSRILAGVSDDIILCHSNKLQIYKPNGVLGSQPDQWRDCIDIAVKLAFSLTANLNLGINKIKLVDYGSNIYAIDYQSLKEHPTVKEVTNQKDLYNKLPDELVVYPLRAKQSSDVAQEKKMTTVLKFLKYGNDQLESKIKLMDLYHYENKIDELLENLFSTPYTPENYDNAIKDFCRLTGEVFDVMGTNEMKLLGMELNAIDTLSL